MKYKVPRMILLVLINLLVIALMTTYIVIKLRPDQDVPIVTHSKPDNGFMLVAQRQTIIEDVLKAPLFNSSRQPVVEVDSTTAPAIASIGPSPILLGIMGDGDTYSALLEDATTNTRQLVQKGQTFSGWSLVSLGGQKAELQAFGKIVVLDLGTPRPASDTPNVKHTNTK